MIRLRNSRFMRAICFLMAISIFTISCDPNGDLLTDSKIAHQAELLASEMQGEYTCQEIEDYLRKAVNYVKLNHFNGIVTSEGALLNFLIEDAKSENKINNADLEAINLIDLSDRMTSLHYRTSTESISDLLLSLKSDGDISNEEFDIILSLENHLKSNSRDDAITVIDNKINYVDENSNLSADNRARLVRSMELAKLMLCDSDIDYKVSSFDKSDNLKKSCEHEICFEEHRWELAVSYVVVTVLTILGWFTFGLTSLVAVLIAVTSWVLVTVVICFIIDCDPDCPEGTEPTCAEGWNMENGFCCHPTANIIEGTGIFAAKTGNDCPPGSIDLGNGRCFIGTFDSFGLSTDNGVSTFDECGGFVGHIPICQ